MNIIMNLLTGETTDGVMTAEEAIEQARDSRNWTMTRREAPPRKGWWMASRVEDNKAYRYWDGADWSLILNWKPGQEDRTQHDIRRVGAKKTDSSDDVSWFPFQPPWGQE